MKGIKHLSEPLTREHIDFRVAQVFGNDNGVWCSILAYKDARVDMQRLDDAVGPLGWQVKYKRDTAGVLQCGIGVMSDLYSPPDNWVWKWSNGVPSNFEQAKGEYSDAFKRAGFMWSIGRQLYDFPKIVVSLIKGDFYKKGDKYFAANKLRPNDWKWTISPDYKDVTAERKLGGKLANVFNSNPYKK